MSELVYRAADYYDRVGSIRFAGVSFQVYTDDHPPRHVHARYAGVTVIIEFGSGGVRVSRRTDRVEPRNANAATLPTC